MPTLRRAHAPELIRSRETNPRMKRFLFSLFTAFALALAPAPPARGQTIDVGATYSISWTDSTILDAQYNLADSDAIETRFPNFLPRLRYLYNSNPRGFGKVSLGFWGSVLALGEFNMAHNDAIWSGCPDWTAGCGSRRNVLDPAGKFPINFPLLAANQTSEGQGSSPFYFLPKGGGQVSVGSTELWLDRHDWLGPDSNMFIFVSNVFGNAGVFAYAEATKIKNYNLDGRCSDWLVDSYHASGIGMWDMGECSLIQNVFAHHFNNAGFELVRGTPNTVFDCSSFFNNEYGYEVVGGSLGTHRFITNSGDANGIALYGCVDGYDRPGGGTWIIEGQKMETNGDTNAVDEPGKPQVFFRAWDPNQGLGIYLNAGFRDISCRNNGIWIDAEILVDDLIGVINTIDVSNFAGVDYKNILRVNGIRYQLPYQVYGAPSFHWSSVAPNMWGLYENSTVTTNSSGCIEQLNGLPRDPQTGQPIGAFDYVACTPEYDPHGPSGGSCTYTYSEWGPCIAGTQTRTVINASPPGCTGVPVLSQSCVAPTNVWRTNFSTTSLSNIPATVNTLGPAYLIQNTSTKQATSIANGIINVSGTRPQASYPLAVNGVRKVVITGFKATSLNNGYVLDKVRLSASGTFIVTGANLVSPMPPTIVAGVTQTITLYFDAPVNIANLFNGTTTANAQYCSMDQLQLFTAY